MDETVLDYNVDDLYHVGGLLSKPKTDEDVTVEGEIDSEEPVIEEPAVPDWEVEEVKDEVADNPKEEKLVEEAFKNPTPERTTKLDYTVDSPKEKEVVDEVKADLSGIGQRVLDSANEKVGANLWDTIIKGV